MLIIAIMLIMHIVIYYAYYFDASYYINYCYYSLFAWCLLCCLLSEGFSCFMFWITLCVPSWPSTLTCRYGTRLMRNPWTCLWRLSWTCKYYLFQYLLGCAWAAFGVRTSRSSTDEFVKKDISWTRTSFIWSTTFSGICHSKTRLTLTGWLS